MARRRKKRREPEAHLAPIPTWVGATTRVAWALFGAGALSVAATQGELPGLIGAAVMLAATGLRMLARVRRDADARRAGAGVPTDVWSLPLGVLLIAGGAAGLLYPALVDVETFRAIVAAHPYGPFVSIGLIVCGLLTLLDHLDRAAPSEPDFAVPDPPWNFSWAGFGAMVVALLLAGWGAHGVLEAMQQESSPPGLEYSYIALGLGVVMACSLGFIFPMWGSGRCGLISPHQLLIAPAALVLPELWRKVPLAMFLYESWVELDREASKEKEARREQGEYDWRPLAVFCLGAVFLSLMEYFGHGPDLRDLIGTMNTPAEGEDVSAFWARMKEIQDGPFGRLLSFMWWSGWRLLGFFLLPAFVLKVMLSERIADHGLQVRGFTEHAWIYGLFLIPVIIAVGVVSYEESFKTYYPFYSAASRSWYDFWAWEALYAVQFFSLEFFFRGFWVKASKSMMGSHAIFAMVVPYCMIHFGKPMPETLAAILAGVVLGTLALRTRSIWSGFLIHVTVAISMDLAALMQTTGLPTRFWPDL